MNSSSFNLINQKVNNFHLPSKKQRTSTAFSLGEHCAIAFRIFPDCCARCCGTGSFLRSKIRNLEEMKENRIEVEFLQYLHLYMLLFEGFLLVKLDYFD